jgi:hypothetical protein
MDNKKIIWLGMFLGSGIGSYIPTLWGDNVFSFYSIILSAIGGLIGIYLGYKINN